MAVAFHAGERIANNPPAEDSFMQGSSFPVGSVLVVMAAAITLAAGSSAAAEAEKKPPTVEEAKAFADAAEARFFELSVAADRGEWVQANFITEDTQILAAQGEERKIAATIELAQKATRFDGLKLPDETARKLNLLKLQLSLAAPTNRAEAEELTQIVARMKATYGKGKYCPPGSDKCLTLEALDDILGSSRKPDELLEAWRGWHAVAAPMRKDYERYVALANKGAKELGFANSGAMWRSKYDMPPDAFAAEVDRLWEQVRPLYLSLHTYVRKRLREVYGESVVPKNGPIPAHLLGNMWAQQWGNLYPLVAPKDANPDIDLTRILTERKVDERQMVRYGEGFFTSLGFAPLPSTFWERSLFTKPRDREVVCHASAWDIDGVEDLRIKMCIQINQEDFSVIHHELGHNFYQRAFNKQAPLFRDSAHDGFHEAIGDTIALSITPSYLKKLGFIAAEPDASKDIGLLLRQALDKVAFLPFGLLIDKWRWQVFSGEIPPSRYNETWWALKKKYQGVAPPVSRSEADFDPAAKYHVSANVPYMRYFLADILQFQFHRALTATAGCKGPLHRCSIYGSREAGARLNAMLEMGQSRPWPDALEKGTGQRKMDASAIVDYFAPLKKWLDVENKGETPGW
jgi:peptidyl-dipeptidase A